MSARVLLSDDMAACHGAGAHDVKEEAAPSGAVDDAGGVRPLPAKRWPTLV